MTKSDSKQTIYQVIPRNRRASCFLFKKFRGIETRLRPLSEKEILLCVRSLFFARLTIYRRESSSGGFREFACFMALVHVRVASRSSVFLEEAAILASHAGPLSSRRPIRGRGSHRSANDDGDRAALDGRPTISSRCPRLGPPVSSRKVKGADYRARCSPENIIQSERPHDREHHSLDCGFVTFFPSRFHAPARPVALSMRGSVCSIF